MATKIKSASKKASNSVKKARTPKAKDIKIKPQPAAARKVKVATKTAKSVSKKLQTVVKASTRRTSANKQETNPPRVSVRNYVIDLLLQEKWTDDEIHSAVIEHFGDLGYTTKKAYIQLTRADMNAGHVKTLLTSGTMTHFIDQLKRDEKGKLVHIPYRPSALRKTSLQFELSDSQ